jgi:hypothetical protein
VGKDFPIPKQIGLVFYVWRQFHWEKLLTMPSIISNASLNNVQHLQELSASMSHDLEMEERQATEDIVSLSSAEERERKIFMGDINKFMAEIGKPLSKIPIMGYKELDLYQLFKEVTAYGGFTEVRPFG